MNAILIRMYPLVAGGFLALLVPLSTPASALDDAAARKTAVVSIMSRQTGIGADCPKTRRKEELEEDLFSIRRDMVQEGRLNETFLVYEVVDVGCYEVENGSLVTHTIDHPGTYGYVVVNKITGKTHRLWADPDASREFNRMIADLGVDAREEHVAIGVARLYRQMVMGPRDDNVIYDDFELRQLAEKSFYQAYGENRWSRRFNTWWSRFATSKRPRFDQVVRRVREGWLVSDKSFEGFKLTIPRTTISGHPAIVESSLRISPAGEVVEMPRQTVFE